MRVEHRLHARPVGDVERGGAGLVALAPQPLGLAFGALGIDIGQGDLGSRLGQHLGIGQADA